MVMARLHVICGNCGRADMFVWDFVVSDSPHDYPDTVELLCKNCCTVHDLNDNAKRHRPKREET